MAIMISLLCVPAGMLAFVIFLWKRTNYGLLLLILPMSAVMFLIWGVYNFMLVKDNSYLLYKLREINVMSLAIFIGITLFAWFSVLNVFVLWKCWNVNLRPFIKDI